MKTKVKIPPIEIKCQIVGVRLSEREISKIKIFCLEHKVSQSNLIRYAIRNYIPDL